MAADLTKPFSESCCDGGACSTEMSAQSCGCDPGLKPTPWVCAFHKLENKMKEAIDYYERILTEDNYGKTKDTF